MTSHMRKFSEKSVIEYTYKYVCQRKIGMKTSVNGSISDYEMIGGVKKKMNC